MLSTKMQDETMLISCHLHYITYTCIVCYLHFRYSQFHHLYFRFPHLHCPLPAFSSLVFSSFAISSLAFSSLALPRIPSIRPYALILGPIFTIAPYISPQSALLCAIRSGHTHNQGYRNGGGELLPVPFERGTLPQRYPF